MQITITRPHFSNDPAPTVHWQDIDGVVFTGSGVYWSADEAEAAPAEKIMEAAFKSSLPVFGSCYGMQLGGCCIGWTNSGQSIRFRNRYSPQYSDK